MVEHPRDGGIHPFFGEPTGPFEPPRRVYARWIEGEEGDFALFDAVDATSFHHLYADVERADRAPWREQVKAAQIYAIEVNPAISGDAALAWLEKYGPEPMPGWLDIAIAPDPGGPAAAYNTITGEPARVDISIRRASEEMAVILDEASDLTEFAVEDGVISTALGSLAIDQVFVLDVGQGSANALLSNQGNVVAYVDLGGGVQNDTGTWPPALTGLCLCHSPPVILTHWHYDHFDAANRVSAAQALTWIAPLQQLSTGPQFAMAAGIATQSKLLLWNAAPGTILSSGNLRLERCDGPAGDQNRTGIAVWVDGSASAGPMLLPGDAGYLDINSLTNGMGVTALAVAHHGGRAAGSPPSPSIPGGSRAAFSYGYNNSYRHPLSRTIVASGGTVSPALTALTTAGWVIGYPTASVDERRTEDRRSSYGAPSSPGGSGLGHIRLSWPGSNHAPFTCNCGAPFEPTQ
ncbi:hypothetical protein [Xanthobacter autotrophicus]|uniref:hypothetical protein n=1 Tax=Xanthobacter autotrophicus TaxID=280 RepID=UPI0037288DC8